MRRPTHHRQSWIWTILATCTTAMACAGNNDRDSLTSGYSRAELKRYSEDSFSAVDRKVYYAGATLPFLNLPRHGERGILVMENGELTDEVQNAKKLAKRLHLDFSIPNSVDEADAATQKVLRFYREQFGRNSYDDKGATINFSVDANRDLKVFSMVGENAAWMTGENPFFFFGVGGGPFKSFIRGIDVIGHEFTHAVVESTSNLAYRGQTGALNEHFADVFGEMLQAYEEEKEPLFLVGDTIVEEGALALRNMLHPDLALSKQPGKMSEIPPEFGESCVPEGGNDHCGVHRLSGIPNRFAALVISKLPWEKSRDLFYHVMTEALTENSKFADYAREMRAYANSHWSFDDAQVVEEALKQVEL